MPVNVSNTAVCISISNLDEYKQQISQLTDLLTQINDLLVKTNDLIDSFQSKKLNIAFEIK